MLEFLLALLTTATVGALLVPLLRASARRTERLDSELVIYRDQLAEIERDRAAGTTSEADAAAARIEVERRILAAANATNTATPTDSSTLHRFLPPALALLIPLLALGVYLQVGRPGLPAAPFGGAPAAQHPNPNQPLTPDRLLAEARARLKEQPDDPEALSALGEALTLEADGTVTTQAAAAFNKALAQRPDDPRTLYYLGLHEAQSGDSKAAIARWQALEAKSPPDAPYLAMLREEIARVSRAAGMPVPPSSGPSRDQVEAMQNLAPEQRQQAIRGMVEGLDARLKENPADRAGWLRLANAWRVLGENARAADAYARADALQPLEYRHGGRARGGAGGDLADMGLGPVGQRPGVERRKRIGLGIGVGGLRVLAQHAPGIGEAEPAGAVRGVLLHLRIEALDHGADGLLTPSRIEVLHGLDLVL